jgi:glutaredoxin 3
MSKKRVRLTGFNRETVVDFLERLDSGSDIDNIAWYYDTKTKRIVTGATSLRATFGFGKSSPYTVYTLDGCPYCEKAVALLESKGLAVKALRGESNKGKVASEMKRVGRVDYNTWPKIFSPDGSFIGGYVDLEKSIK